MYDIAIVIINYNTSHYTLECVKSVVEKTKTGISYQIIVVDNNSNIEDYKNLKKGFPNNPNISLHRSVINTGFGGGNMFGVQFCNAKYLLFLNNDAFLLNDCISILYNYMETHTEIGVCTAQNYDEHQEHVKSFDHNKGLRRLLFGRGFLEKTNPEKYPKRKTHYKTPITVNWVNGAFMFFKTGAFSKVGGFDTNIFLFCEEMDICKRLFNIGLKSSLVPEAKITHYQGKSTGVSNMISKEGYISYLYVLKKNNNYLKYITIRCYLFFICLIKPKKWFLLSTILRGADLSKSLKLKQQIYLNSESKVK